jgi:hypothetical protein
VSGKEGEPKEDMYAELVDPGAERAGRLNVGEGWVG